VISHILQQVGVNWQCTICKLRAHRHINVIGGHRCISYVKHLLILFRLFFWVQVERAEIIRFYDQPTQVSLTSLQVNLRTGRAYRPDVLRMSRLEASVELIDQFLEGGMPTNVCPVKPIDQTATVGGGSREVVVEKKEAFDVCCVYI